VFSNDILESPNKKKSKEKLNAKKEYGETMSD
jgi:hypothetical protein